VVAEQVQRVLVRKAAAALGVTDAEGRLAEAFLVLGTR